MSGTEAYGEPYWGEFLSLLLISFVTDHGGSGHLSRDDLLLHLLSESILQREVVPSVDQQLVFQVLRRVEILARRLLTVAPALKLHWCQIIFSWVVLDICKQSIIWH